MNNDTLRYLQALFGNATNQPTDYTLGSRRGFVPPGGSYNDRGQLGNMGLRKSLAAQDPTQAALNLVQGAQDEKPWSPSYDAARESAVDQLRYMMPVMEPSQPAHESAAADVPLPMPRPSEIDAHPADQLARQIAAHQIKQAQSPQQLPQQSPQPDSRSLWDIYNQSGNAADFARADQSMQSGYARGGSIRNGYDDGGPVTPQTLAQNISGPEDQGAASPDWPDALKEAANLSPGDWATAVAKYPAYKLDQLKSFATLPHDVMTGQTDPMSDEGFARAQGLAGLAMTGGLGGVPVEAGEAVLGSGPIRAYHGSPHDFDRFDISKIGTGEGAQAYGHGLYFADKEGVAKSYRDTLSKKAGQDPAYWDNVQLPPSLSRDESSDLNRLGVGLRQIGNLPPEDMEMYRSLVRKQRSYDDAIQAAKPTGRMYEVNLHADPEHLLDWDKPLYQQAPAVQSAYGWTPDKMAEYKHIMGGHDDDLLRALTSNADTSASMANANKQAQLLNRSVGVPGDALGANLYESRKLVPGDYRDPAAASKELLNRGIPGLRYLDGGSRGAGEGTSNYVMFDHKPVEIVRKYARGGSIEDRALMVVSPKAK